jgi:hypothetical protein
VESNVVSVKFCNNDTLREWLSVSNQLSIGLQELIEMCEDIQKILDQQTSCQNDNDWQK